MVKRNTRRSCLFGLILFLSGCSIYGDGKFISREGVNSKEGVNVAPVIQLEVV